MKTRRFIPKRFQLKKEAIHPVLKGHPWVFRSHLSSAASVFKSGDLLSLVDSENNTLGYGLFDMEGLIAIRVLKRGRSIPDTLWFRDLIEKALKKRSHVRKYTDGFRALHGENDGLPGIVFDVYGTTGVLQTYASSVDTLGRYIAGILKNELELKNVIWKLPTKRKDRTESSVRVLSGEIPKILRFREGKLELSVEIGAGQKSGMFLDLRGLRKWLSQRKRGTRVLNLFSYTGTLGLAAEVGGGEEIWNVDISKGALESAKRLHCLKEKRQKWIAADVFDWVQKLAKSEIFDLIIVDPPLMASQVSQVEGALRSYRQIYKHLLPHLGKGGKMVVCCCTSRISRRRFCEEADRTLGKDLVLMTSLEPEEDHPVGFAEGDYLKILVYEKRLR